MQDLQAAFLADAPRRIQNLREDLNRLRFANSSGQAELVKKLFRQMHTLKGSSAAFDLTIVCRIAHELENFLEIVNPKNLPESIRVLGEGIQEIETAFAQKEHKLLSPGLEQKIAGWKAIYQELSQSKVQFSKDLVLPFDLEKQLKQSEIERLRKALESNSTLAVISAKFDASNFAERFCALQNLLNQQGEIVSTLPDAEKTKPTEIALRLVFVCNEPEEKINEILAETDAKIIGIFDNKCHNEDRFREEPPKTRLSNLWMQASLGAQKSAASQGKKIVFQKLENNDVELWGQLAESCEIALLHIARNAVAHGIELPEERRANGKNEAGLINFEVWRENETLCLRITDDGRGIDREKIWRIAAERNLIGATSKFDEMKAEQIIFSSGFSTAVSVTEDAGRGVGLDAVQTAVRAAGGTIAVNSEPERGTEFLIRFPYENKNT